MVSKLQKFTKYIFVLFLLEFVSCNPSKNIWDIIGEEIGESVNVTSEEIGKYEDKLCHIDNIECYDCKDFKSDEETCRNFSYCWFNCLTNECLHKDDIAPKKYCSTYCQECACLDDDKCTWDPDGLCTSSHCPRPDQLPFDNEKHCHFRQIQDRDRESSAFFIDGRICGVSPYNIVPCHIVRSWTIRDGTAVNIGSDGQFQLQIHIWPGSDLSGETETFYLSFNGFQIPVKYPLGYARLNPYYINFIVENGQPKITGFANKKPLEPLQDNTHLSLSCSSSGNCQLGRMSAEIEVFQLSEHWKCSGFSGDQCQCQQSFSGCRYIHGNKDCVGHKLEDDSQIEYYSFRYCCASTLGRGSYNSDTVRRYFVEDGNFREIDIDANYGCEIQEKIIAVNINGEEFTDTNGIVHDAGSTVAPDDSAESAEFEVGEFSTSPCKDYSRSEVFKTVQGTFAQGKITSNDDLGKCLRYSFSVTIDGLYMLNVRMFDPNSNEDIFDRMFDLKLNNIVVAGGINTFRLPSIDHCQGFDINIYFEVSNGLKTVKMTSDNRIPDWEISNGTMTVGFCNSPCEGNSAFIVSAFSVARYTFTEADGK